ncbi:hypothetical protein [Heyndrickxia acidicola]|uniref:NADH dehydrogenase subunit 4L n=1 Tax=Heyndrickxia acidicola TaxID=209389 RepID=A0ABU6MF74_9BACI|nr:hypothetical protein [Heyndrickxia acidicola]MED1203337.1 hypothetical protein [Heyndrickxia acidicola]
MKINVGDSMLIFLCVYIVALIAVWVYFFYRLKRDKTILRDFYYYMVSMGFPLVFFPQFYLGEDWSLALEITGMVIVIAGIIVTRVMKKKFEMEKTAE